MLIVIDAEGKRLGNWTNDGICESDFKCGPGTQKQTRCCIDGSTDKCTPADKEQTISCSEAVTCNSMSLITYCIKYTYNINQDWQF